jgi:cytochrome c peroxidase
MRGVARAIATLAVSLAACSDGPAVGTPLADRVPAGFPPMEVPDDNPTTVEGVALGRQLYYDVRLSPDGSRACASCHLQAHGFSTTTPVGVLPHINLAWSRNFLWDGRFEGTLEEAMVMEVEEFFATDVERLRAPDLEDLFEAAFGTREVTTHRAAYALAQFQRRLVSGGSRFDRYAAGDLTALTDAELRGGALFHSERAECFHCHATRLFTDNLFHDIGLEAAVAGSGRGAVTGRSLDDGKWKTPTLRNAARTAPYMHDGRFATLDEVVAFYAGGVTASRNLDTLVPVGGYRLTAEERADLVAFLEALTDEVYLSDPELGPPP